MRNPRPTARRRAFLSACGVSALLAGCAGPGPGIPESPARDAAEALRLAEETRLELQTQSVRLGELEGQIRDLSEMLAWSAARTPMQERAPDRAQDSPAPVAPPEPRTRVTPGEATEYREALDLFFARRYPASTQAFRELLARRPKGAYAGNAEYWIGEGLYAQGDYAGAAAAFQRVFQHPGSPKTDDAQLKLGYCRLRIGDRAGARAEFRKLVSLHPASEYVERARSELEKLGTE